MSLSEKVRFLWRVLRGGDMAAYHFLGVKVAQVLFTPADMLLAGLERAFGAGAPQSRYPMIIVTGIQRSGTTFVAQALSHALPVTPLSNFNIIFPRSRRYAHRLGAWLLRRNNKASYKNFYGYSVGLFGASDCYEVWDRWFGRDHFNMPEALSQEATDDMAHYFASLREAYGRALLTKNNRNILAIDTFDRVFPDALFIEVDRELPYVVQSILAASETFFGDQKKLWGTRPHPDFDSQSDGGLVEATCAQCVALQRMQTDQLEKIDTSRRITIPYERFCEDPGPFVRRIHAMIEKSAGVEGLPLREEYSPFTSSRSIRDPERFARIVKALEKLESQ